MYRDGVFIYNGPNTINQFTDNTQLNISTVYEYSVVAISCAGTSTAGVKSVSIGGERSFIQYIYFELIHCYLVHTLTSPSLFTLSNSRSTRSPVRFPYILEATYSWVSQ